METRQELERELRGLDAEMQELKEKVKAGDASATEIKRMNSLLDQMETVIGQLDARDQLEGRPSQTQSTAERRAPTEAQYHRWGEFIQAVCAAGSEPGRSFGRFQSGTIYRDTLRPENRSTGGEESTPSLGGFAVGQDFAAEIYSRAHPVGSLYDRCRRITISTNANGIKLPYVDESSRADGSRPLRGYWTDEGGSLTAKNVKLGAIEMSLKKVTLLSYLTSELLSDAPALAEWVLGGFAKESRFKINTAIIRGSGSGQPVGLLNATALVNVAKAVGQPKETILWDNIKAMYAQLYAPSRSNMVWITNQNCLEQLMSMVQPVGTGGIPVWMPASGGSGSPYDTLLGRPLLLEEACSKLGTKGDIFAFDPKEYLIIEKAPQFAQSAHVLFTSDEQCLRYIKRVDGQAIWGNSLVPYQDTTTSQPVSPYVTLAVRA